MALPKPYQINQVEHQIRKIERGIKVLYTGGAPPSQILERGVRREELKDRLESLTGSRIPKSPEWPL